MMNAVYVTDVVGHNSCKYIENHCGIFTPGWACVNTSSLVNTCISVHTTIAYIIIVTALCSVCVQCTHVQNHGSQQYFQISTTQNTCIPY